MVKKLKIDIFDKLILVVAGVCLLYALYLYDSDGEMYPINKRSIVPIHGDDTHFVVNYFFNSTVYSAQNKIYVSIIAWPLPDFYQKHQNNANKIDLVYIYFNGMSTKFDKVTENGVFPPIFGMKKGDDGRFRGGPFEIIYQEEGHKCAMFSLEKLTSTLDVCDEKNSVINVSSADSFLQLENNKTILVLTWIFIAFGVIAIRDPLRNIFSSCFSEKSE